MTILKVQDEIKEKIQRSIEE